MFGQKRFLVACLFLLTFAAVEVRSVAALSSQTGAAPKLSGRWRVKFALSGVEKNLTFEPKANGVGVFMLLDTGPDNQPVPDAAPALWSQLTNDRVSFSGEMELPIGTCCREIGTLVFKGKFDSSNSISGRVIFVTSVEEEESPFKFRSVIGNFTATRVSNTP